ncbi:MAG: hypothetical protein Q9209_006754 [Squamulea sp. 1 TL-2023]
MFREPEVEAGKATEKKGDLAASARSSIRRQRSVRYTHRDRNSSRHPQTHRHDQPLVARLRARDRERVASIRSNAERALDVEIAADQAHSEASRQRRLESGRAILRDALSYEHPQQSRSMGRDRLYPSNMIRPPTPSSTSFRHPLRHLRHRPVVPRIGDEGPFSRSLAQTPPPAYIPSPPYTSDGRSNRSSPDILQPAHAIASLTPRFAPAHVVAQSDPVQDRIRFSHRQHDYEDGTTNDSMLDELPLLRQVNRRYSPSRSNRVPSVHGVIDGLGDRWRSVSPDTDPWEILLSTVPPDERLPSTAASSFRSNEDLTPYEQLTDLTESMDYGTSSYPVICDNSDSDFTETEDDARVHPLGVANDRSASRAQRRSTEFSTSAPSGGLIQHSHRPRSTRQQQALSLPVESTWSDRILWHVDEMEMLTSNGRSGRERL